MTDLQRFLQMHHFASRHTKLVLSRPLELLKVTDIDGILQISEMRGLLELLEQIDSALAWIHTNLLDEQASRASSGVGLASKNS